MQSMLRASRSGANNEDTVVWEWYNGIIYVLKGQPMGTIPYQGATLYLSITFWTKKRAWVRTQSTA